MDRAKGQVWTDEEKAYLKEIAPGRHHKEIQKLMSEKFKMNFTTRQISAAIKRYKLNTGLTGCFKKGRTPHNKGQKGICAKGCEKTWFKKGNRPKNYKPIGSERLTKDGYVMVKIADPNKWRLKSIIVWEKAHERKVPKNHVIVFADGNTQNFDLDNLLLVTRAELALLNKYKYIKKGSAEITKTALNLVKLEKKINEVNR